MTQWNNKQYESLPDGPDNNKTPGDVSFTDYLINPTYLFVFFSPIGILRDIIQKVNACARPQYLILTRSVP